ncbi:MAG: AI-2E family transporter, partial [Pseudonocardiales bacterium]|nr:AI-2E family transporter [Pseudonocardiales bacterium]
MHNPNTAHPQTGTTSSPLKTGHHALIAQPHTEAEGPIAAAEGIAAGMRSEQYPLGQPGAPLDAKSAFLTGMSAAAGVAVTAGLVAMIITVRGILVLIGLALFLALGLEPAVSVLARRWLPRWIAVVTVIMVVLAVIGGFVAAAIPPLARQASQFVTQAPAILARLHNHQSFLGQLTDRLHLQQRLQQTLSGDASGLFTGLLGAGQVVLNALSSTGIVVVLIVYFVADLPRIRTTLYRLVPNSRRPRAILLGDEIFAKVGGYVLGNLLTSLIAGTLTTTFLAIAEVPYPLLLGIFVAIVDLLPVIGSAIAGVGVCLVALSVSLPVCLATIGFFIVYRLAEDYLIVPRIIGQAVQVPAVVTVVAALLGGALQGIVGALVAIPAAAALLLLTQEVLFPLLDRT